MEIFTQDTSLRSALQEQHLRRVPDLDRMAKKFQKGKVVTLNNPNDPVITLITPINIP